MFDPFANSTAFDTMMEDLVWTQRRGRTASTIRGIVLHNRKQIEVYETIANGVVKRYSDTWKVIVAGDTARIVDLAVGDTFQRQTVAAEKLTVQGFSREDDSWVIDCTANVNGGAV